MPLALDPNELFELSLSRDEQRFDEPATRPVFVFRFMTGREWKTVARLSESIEDSTGGAEAIEKVFEALATSLCGWRNVTDRQGEEIPFNASDLDLVLNPPEAVELLERVMAHVNPSGDDLKKSGSPSP